MCLQKFKFRFVVFEFQVVISDNNFDWSRYDHSYYYSQFDISTANFDFSFLYPLLPLDLINNNS